MTTYTFEVDVSSAAEVDGRAPVAQAPPAVGPLSGESLERMHRYWEAANYLTVGQIYLKDNPLLREPLAARAHQAAAARSLGNVARPEPVYTSPESPDLSARC